MLSILIPTKDYNCRSLVTALHKQGEELGIPFEIIVGEDGSSPDERKKNAQTNDLPNYRTLVSEHNIGRSKMRNLLAKNAKYSNIMFIDSDAAVERHDILAKYTAALTKHPVVCGGLYHADIANDKSQSLRHKYEKEADKHRSAKERRQNPYDKFATFCFAIHKELFLQIGFNEDISRYGHEDTLFGKELQKRGIAIKHIDAPLLHTGLENNETYLKKVEDSIITLVEFEKEIGATTLLECYSRIKIWHLTRPVAIFWNIAHPLLHKNLLGTSPSLTILKIYKIGFLCHIKNKQSKQKEHKYRKND